MKDMSFAPLVTGTTLGRAPEWVVRCRAVSMRGDIAGPGASARVSEGRFGLDSA